MKHDKIYYLDAVGAMREMPRGDVTKELQWDTFKRKILSTTIIAAIFGILGGFGVGFAVGLHSGIEYQKHKDDKEIIRMGYTVLDANHVIMANGDTAVYRWNKYARK